MNILSGIRFLMIFLFAFISIGVRSQSITTGNADTAYCAGYPVSISYTVTGIFNAGNIFTLQLSDNSGSFSQPLNLGTLSGTGSGTISTVIPSVVAGGTGYRVRVVSSSPAVTGTSSSQNSKINPSTFPSVTLSTFSGSTQNVCSNNSISVLAKARNAGVVPFFEWFRNGVAVLSGA